MLRFTFVLLALCVSAFAQGQTTTPSPASVPAPAPPMEYGTSIRLADARRVLEAAEKEAIREEWPVAIAIVDPAGFMVAFVKLDNTQLGSIEVATQKARTATLFRRATKDLEDRLAQGAANLKILSLPGLPIEGGIPLVVDGKIVGAIGVSGVQSNQDAQVALSGARTLTPMEK